MHRKLTMFCFYFLLFSNWEVLSGFQPLIEVYNIGLKSRVTGFARKSAASEWVQFSCFNISCFWNKNIMLYYVYIQTSVYFHVVPRTDRKKNEIQHCGSVVSDPYCTHWPGQYDLTCISNVKALPTTWETLWWSPGESDVCVWWFVMETLPRLNSEELLFSSGVISIFSNSLSFPSLTVTAKTLHRLRRGYSTGTCWIEAPSLQEGPVQSQGADRRTRMRKRQP